MSGFLYQYDGCCKAQSFKLFRVTNANNVHVSTYNFNLRNPNKVCSSLMVL